MIYGMFSITCFHILWPPCRLITLALKKIKRTLSVFVSSSVFGTVPVGASAQTQPASSSVPAPFGATPSTNPFVAAAGPSVASSTNPFQTNARGATGRK